MADEGVWDVAVIGGGVVGLSAALHLLERGRRVVVIDRDRPRERASFGNAGVISRGSILTVASPSVWANAVKFAIGADPAVRIRWSSLPAFAAWLRAFLPACTEAAWRSAAGALSPLTALALEHHAQLARLAGCKAMLRRTGYLKLYRTERGFAGAALEREILHDQGVRAEPLDGAGVRELEPALAGFVRGLFFPESASVDSPGALVEAYRSACLQRGGGWRAGEALALEARNDAVLVRTAEGQLAARTVVLAGGVESGRLLRPLGYRVPLAAERGYHVRFAARPDAALGRPIHDVEGAYAAAPMEGGVRVLTGVELARPTDPPDHAQLDAILARARAALPLGDICEGAPWVGSRPSVADGLPVIGRASRCPRLLLAFGHGHIGLSTGPLTGRLVADLETGAAPPIPLTPYRIERFG